MPRSAMARSTTEAAEAGARGGPAGGGCPGDAAERALLDDSEIDGEVRPRFAERPSMPVRFRSGEYQEIASVDATATKHRHRPLDRVDDPLVELEGGSVHPVVVEQVRIEPAHLDGIGGDVLGRRRPGAAGAHPAIEGDDEGRGDGGVG